MSFGFTAIAITLATLAPSVMAEEGQEVGKGFGPFQKGAEIANGRAAMMGFIALIVAEKVTGAALL